MSIVSSDGSKIKLDDMALRVLFLGTIMELSELDIYGSGNQKQSEIIANYMCEHEGIQITSGEIESLIPKSRPRHPDY